MTSFRKIGKGAVMSGHKRGKNNGAFGRKKPLKGLASLLNEPMIKALHGAVSEEAKAEVAGTIRATLRSHGLSPLNYQSDLLLKPGWPMELWLAMFAKYSVMPPALTFWITFSLVGHWLASRGAVLQLASDANATAGSVRPILWTLVAGPAGSGKGVVYSAAREALGLKDMPMQIPVCGSRQRWYQHLMENVNQPVIQVIDEFPKFWKSMRSSPDNDAWVGDYILSFQHEKIELDFKTTQYAVENPMLSLLALAQPDSLRAALVPDDYASGFMRRWLIIFASGTGYLTMADKHKYEPDAALEHIRKSGVMQRWQTLLKDTPVHPVYRLSKSAKAYLRHHVLDLGIKADLTADWITTAAFHARKFALIFHFLHGNQGTVIERKSAEYACRCLGIVYSNLRHLLDQANTSILAEAVDHALVVRTEIESGKRKGAWDYKRVFDTFSRAAKWAPIQSPEIYRFIYELVSNIRDEDSGDGNVVNFKSA